MIWSQPNNFNVVLLVIFFVTKKTKKLKLKLSFLNPLMPLSIQRKIDDTH